MKTVKPYSMELRAAGVEATRERILTAAADVFLERWYDDVTLAELAKRAGVSGQTVINHYGGKEQLATAAYDYLGKQITLRRYTPEPGDVEGAIEALVEDYEITGDAVIRMLALEEKVATLARSSSSVATAIASGSRRCSRHRASCPSSSSPRTSTPGSCCAVTRDLAARRPARPFDTWFKR